MFSLIHLTLLSSLLGLASAAPIKRATIKDRQLFDKIGDFVGDAIDKAQSVGGDFIEDVAEGVGIIDGPTGDENFAATSALDGGLLNELTRTAHFSNAAYCSAQTVRDWTCGASCDFLGDIEVLFTGGDNEDIPAFFVAFDPSINSVVLSTQGTEATEIESIIIDLELNQVPLNPANFPSAGPDVLVHSGFQRAFERTAEVTRTEVEKALASKGTNQLLVTGHSLGAALATLNAMFLKEDLGDAVQITTRVFGLPRAGNGAFANYVDRILGVGPSYLHMHTGKDIVPTIPPASLLDYTHPSGEIFDNLDAEDGSTAVLCPGQENQNCSAGNNILEKSILDHIGPFAGVDIGIFSCTV